ncbi:MAG: ECF transporter S component [Clostridia bacterium]|nr:ECF transporter S component [Clostridia bacterium]
MRKNISVQAITRIAVLTALASILFLIEIPVVAFYKLDLSNLPVLLGAFSMGPAAGIVILGLKSLIGMLHSTSMYVGELADFIMGAAMILPAAVIYRVKKTRGRALTGMIIGTVLMAIVGVIVNKYIMIPFYMNAYGMPMEAVIGMASAALPFVDTEWKLLLFVTAPFNLLKGIVLSALTFLLYKRLSPLLHVKGDKR